MTVYQAYSVPSEFRKNVLESPGAEGTDNQWLLYRYVKLYRKITNRKITPMLKFARNMS